jgi:D-3-phosphoglycerate dehydrogenase / 2-oxoglutarate reductase
MPHILVAGKIHPSGVVLLDETAGVSYTLVEEVSEVSYAAHVATADAVVIRTQPMSASTIALAPNLKIVSRHGVGYDAVDVSALNARKIPLAIVGDVNSGSVAEHAMMLILAASHRLIRADQSVRTGNWGWRNRLEGSEVAGKRLLIVGYGRIGRNLARMAASFGIEVVAYDPYLEKAGWPLGDVAPVSNLGEGLASTDIITLHVPKPEKPVLGIEELALLKRGAIVINTARGGLVDEMALADALRSGQVGAIGFDVFDDEPPANNHPLIGFDQAILTPHNAALTLECGERMAVQSVQNVLDFFAGKLDSSLIVNKDKL